jgi:hypothetical protein
VQAESELLFSGLADLLRPVSSSLATIPPAHPAALAGDRLTICAATPSLLAAAAEKRPVLAVVDDLQWLDVASTEALLFAAWRLGAEGAALLFSLGEEEEGLGSTCRG